MQGNLNEGGQESNRLTVPTGFRNLLEGLTVEILRSNPDDIYTFAAEYFKSRLEERQVRGYDDCLLGSQIDGYYRYEPLRGNQDGLDDAAAKIQATSRSHKARQEVQKRKTLEKQQAEQPQVSPGEVDDSFGFSRECYGRNEHMAATRIQAGYRGYYTRRALRVRNDAATTIQAGYRGHMARKGVKEKIDGRPNLQTIDEENEPTDITQREEEAAAAVKIQSAFRGHRSGEAVKNEKEGKNSGQKGHGSTAEDLGPAANDIESHDAATKIQSSYRAYYTRKQLHGKQHAATKIQACYRGHRVRKLRRTQSEAAVKIQSYYRGYKTREQLKKRHSTKTFLEVTNDNEFALHRDSRTSFSLPEGVKFEGSLDDDSDTEIEKMVDEFQTKQELKAIEVPNSQTKTEG